MLADSLSNFQLLKKLKTIILKQEKPTTSFRALLKVITTLQSGTKRSFLYKYSNFFGAT